MDTRSTKRTEYCSQLKRRFGQHHIVKKVLLVLLVLLLATLAFLSYLLVMERQKNSNNEQASRHTAGDEPSPKNHTDGLSTETTCMKKSCVLNAADRLSRMDSTADPCQDFYTFACGGYDKTTSIPPSLKEIHVLQQLQDANTEFLRILIENEKIRTHYSKNIPVTKVLQAYDMCMDTASIAAEGLSPFTELLDEVGGSNITSPEWNEQDYDVYKTLLQLKKRLDFNAFFRVGVWINQKNSSKHAFLIWSTGLALNTKRHLYKKYMVKMMKNVQAPERDVEHLMHEVYKLEKHIAKIHIKFGDHKLDINPTIGELSNFTKFEWLPYLKTITKDIGYSPSSNDVILVQSPLMLKHIIKLINNTDRSTLSNYIAWTLFQEVLHAIPETYSRIKQSFLNSVQIRSTEQPRRWKICVDILSKNLKQVLSFLYVDQKFSEQSKERANEIFEEIRTEFLVNLQNKTWMDAKTKREASEKAKGINYLVGYNEELKNTEKLEKFHDGLQVNRSSFFQTYLNLRGFQMMSENKKLLSPVEKNSFDVLSFQANAYYSRQENKILFLAGILQNPFYDKQNSRASNYGALGMIVGHELTHAFDSNGHRYDKVGELRNWWTNFSLENFHKKSKCFVEQYQKFSIFGRHIQTGKALGEIIADNGGLKLAYNAYKQNEKTNGKEPPLPGLNLTNDQVFFLSFAQNWCSKYTEDGVKETINRRVPMMFRVTGTLQNSVDFSKAYSCPLGAKMNPPTKCELW